MKKEAKREFSIRNHVWNTIFTTTCNSLKECVLEAIKCGIKLEDAQLDGIDLNGANLVRADFSGANLRNADMRGSTLVQARFINAILVGANLTGANLEGAILIGANFSSPEDNKWSTELSYANLSSAMLDGANFKYANLYHTNFTDAVFGSAYFDPKSKKIAIIPFRTKMKNMFS